MIAATAKIHEIGGTFSSDRRQIFNLTVVYQTPRLSNHSENVFFVGLGSRRNLQRQVA